METGRGNNHNKMMIQAGSFKVEGCSSKVEESSSKVEFLIFRWTTLEENDGTWMIIKTSAQLLSFEIR
jgi:hypothetical protein